MRAAEYRRTLDRISRSVADLARSVGRFLATTDRTDADLADAARVLYPAVTAGREQAHDAAASFLSGQANLQGYTSTVPVPKVRDYPQETLEKALKDSVGGNVTESFDFDGTVAKVAVRHTEEAARKTVEDAAQMSATPDPATGKSRPVIGWARQLTGAENCPFCVIMASRGAIYHSRQTALYSGGDAFSNDLSDGMGRYHNGCDCVAVPVYDLKSWDGNATARRLYRDVYRKALELYPDDDAFTAVRKFMIHDLEDDGLKVPQMRSGEIDVPDEDDVPDFVTDDLLSGETQELIEGVKDRLPRTKEEWEEIRQSSGMTALERMRGTKARYLETRAKEASKKATDYKKWGDFDLEAEYRADAKKDRATAKEYRMGKRDDELRQKLLDYGDDPEERLGFEEDVDGKILPPQSYLDRVDEVQKVGRAALDDYRRALDTDPDLKDLVAAEDAARRELSVRMDEVIRLTRLDAEERRAARDTVPEPASGGDDDIDAWLKALEESVPEESETSKALEIAQARGEEARLHLRSVQEAQQTRRGELLTQIVGSRRPLAERDVIDAQPGRDNPHGPYGKEKAAAAEDLERIRKASTLFPGEWVEKMNADRGTLYVTTSARGYYMAKNPFSTNPGDQINLSGGYAWNRGGIFADSTEKTAAHEIGHRMEKILPAIPRLEWAYLYRRATSKGKRENLKWIGAGGKDEKALHDGFRNAYTGKVYGDVDYRPWEFDGWEVFTTGLEALYGDDERYQDADGDLQSFILGLLRTV